MATNEFGDTIQEQETNEFGDPIGVAVAEPISSTSDEILDRMLIEDIDAQDLLPSEQATLAKSVIDTMDDPADYKARLSNNIILSNLFNADVNAVNELQPEMIKEMYGEELNAMAANNKLKEDIGFWKRLTKNAGRSVAEAFETLSVEGGLGEVAVIIEMDRIAREEKRVFNDKTVEQWDALTLEQQDALPEFEETNEQGQPVINLSKIKDRSDQAVTNIKEESFGAVNKFLSVPPAKDFGDKMADIGGGVIGFAAKLRLAKSLMGGNGIVADGASFEVVGLVNGSKPGVGSLTALGLGAINKVPAAGIKGTVGKLSAQGSFFAGITAAEGGSPEDIAMSFLMPFVLKATKQSASLVGDQAIGTFWKGIFPKLRKFSNADVARANRAKNDMFKVQKGTLSRDQWRQRHGQFTENFAKRVTQETKPVQDAVRKQADIVKPTALPGEVSAGAGAIAPVEAKTEVKLTETVAGEVEITTPDQSLIDERKGILATPAKERKPVQIERLAEIENDLIERNQEKFPRTDITEKSRKSEIKKVEDAIKKNPAFQLAEESTGELIVELPQVFSVSEGEMSEIKEIFEGKPDVLKRFKVAKGGNRLDIVAQEIASRGRENLEIVDEPSFNEMLDIIERNVQAETGLTEGTIQQALESGDEELQMLALKRELLAEGESAVIINEELTDLANQIDIPPEAIGEFLVPVEGVSETQRRADILKEVTKVPKKKPVRKPEQDAIKKATDKAFSDKEPKFIVEKDGKFSVTKRRPTKGEFIRVTPPAPGELEGKTERLVAGPTTAEVAEGKKLKQQINIVAKGKGFSKKRFDQIKMDTAGTKKLTRMTNEELQDVLKSTKRARPKIVNRKTVVTPKTERQIASLRDNLTKSELMNDEEFDRILAEETGGKLPKYINEKAFITQSEGRKVLAHMHDSAEKLRATESLNRAIAGNDEILIENEKLTPVPNVIGAKNPNRLLSMRYFVQRMAERTDTQLYHIWQDLTNAHQSLTRKRRQTLNELESTKGFTEIARDKEALQRVSDHVASTSSLKNKPKAPKDITDNELALARKIQKVYKDYELHARIGKFFQHIDDVTMIPQYQQHKKAIDKALDIYNTQGLDALFDYMQTQPWGIVTSGYEPMESTIRGISTHELPLIAVPKTHIKERGIEYNTQERNILQRTDSYMRQMDFLAFLQPKIKSLVRSSNEVLDQFETPADISQAISTYIDNVKKTNNEDGLVEQVMRKIYSQAITTLVLADPVKPVRNLLQNAAFAQDKLDFINPDNKQLTEQESEFMETFVHQDRVMLSDWAFTGEEAFYFPGIGQQRLGLDKVTKWVQRNTQYPASDRINRTWSFWAKVNRTKRAFAKKQSLSQKMAEARFSDMQKQEQQMALGILARDGVDSMARYVAKVHTDNTHFLYAREQRSPAEQTKLGRLILNLALFKRAALEKATLQVQKVAAEGDTASQRFRAAQVLATLIASSIITNLIWKKFTGKEQGAYDFINFLQFDAGGLELNATQHLFDVYNSMLDGDVAALSIQIPKAADTFIPFYDLGLRFIEATIDSENIDRTPFRKLRELIDAEYKSRGIPKVERSLVEKLQFVAAKSKPKKDKKKKKSTSKPFTPRR